MEVQNDATIGLNAAQKIKAGAFGLQTGLRRCQLGGGGGSGCKLCSPAIQIAFILSDQLVQSPLLLGPHGSPAELRAIKIRGRSQSAGFAHEITQALAFPYPINSRGPNLSVQTYELSLLHFGYAQIRLRKNGNDIAGLQSNIIRAVMLKNNFAKIERNQPGGEVLRVH